MLIFLLSVMTQYYDKTNEYTGPQDTLSFAIGKFKSEGVAPGKAIDLGCGTGNDTYYLVEQGWAVRAMDNEASAQGYLIRKIPTRFQNRVTFEACPFERFAFSPALLINASYCLEYCNPHMVKQMMQRLTANLVPGGRFCGHFLGKKDQWVSIPTMNFATKEDLAKYFAGFEIELLEEKEYDGTCFDGPKHWHVYKIVAKKLHRA